MKSISIASDRDFTQLRQYLSTAVAPNVADWDRKEYFPLKVFSEFHRMGLMSVGWPTSEGQAKWRMIDLLEIAAEISFHSAGIFTSWIGNLLVQTAISRFGSSTMIERVRKEQTERQSLLAFCATELGTGTDIIRMQTSATETETGFRITGEKHYITNANHASHFVVFARVPSRSSSRDPSLTAFLVPASSPGVHVGEALHKLGQRESNTSSVSFRGVEVPADSRIGEFGEAFRILMTCVSRTKTLISGAAVGVCRRAETEAVTYLMNTQRYEAPLLARKEIQGLLSELRARLDAAWLLACRSGAVWDEKGIATCESAMAKLFATDLATRFVSEALELSGASGYMQESFLTKLYRDVKVMEIYEGASLVQQAMIAKDIYGPLLKEAAKVVPLRKVA